MSLLVKGFLDDIVANIDDDTPRLVFADWLMENGEDDRAELIRVQIRRARLPSWDAEQVALRLIEEGLLKRHGEKWLAEMPAIEGARWEGFRRGIVAEVSFTDFEAMRKSAHACRAVAPVEAVKVRWPRRGETGKTEPIAELRELTMTGRSYSMQEIGWLADSPQLATLHRLTMRGLWHEALGRLVASPHLAELKSLHLPSNNLDDAGLQQLVREASFFGLEELEVSARTAWQRYMEDEENPAPPGLIELAGWEGLASVKRLDLSSHVVARAGLRALLASPHLAELKELSIRAAALDGESMAEFAEASGPMLDALDLGENLLRQEVGVRLLGEAKCLAELKELRLDRCEIPMAGATSWARNAAHLASLRVLEISHNQFGVERHGSAAPARAADAAHAAHPRQRPFRLRHRVARQFARLRHAA